MTEAQIKKFMSQFGAKYNRKTKKYKIGISSSIEVPKDYFKNSKVGRKTLIAILDQLVNAVSEEAEKQAQWLRENF